MKKHGLIPFAAARSLVLAKVRPVAAVARSLARAAGFILREDIRADRPLPPFNRSSMDGYAVRCADIGRGIKKFRVLGTLEAGAQWRTHAGKGECVKIMTGAPVPDGLDTVIKIEHARERGGYVEFSEPDPARWLNVHRKGADAAQGDALLKKGTPLTPRAVAVAAGCGAGSVRISRPIAVCVVSTGSELVPLSKKPSPAQIRDSNSPMLLARLGAIPWVKVSSAGIVKDDPVGLKKALKRRLAASDMVIITGGVSTGDADFTPRVLRELGVRDVFYKCAIRPGKPVWFGMAGNTAVLGLPGNPVSVAATFHEFALPALKKMAACSSVHPLSVSLPLAGPAKKKHALREFRVGRFDGAGVSPLASYQGSGDYVSAAHSDGLIVLPEDTRELPAGAIVEFHPWDGI